MLRSTFLVAFAVSTFALLGVSPGVSQETEKKPAASAPATTQEKPAAVQPKPAATQRRQPAGRLPNYYGQLGLSNEQRLKVYAVQAKYAEEIQALRKQIAELEAKRDGEIDALCTETQKTQLGELREKARTAMEERRARVAAEQAAEAKARPAP